MPYMKRDEPVQVISLYGGAVQLGPEPGWVNPIFVPECLAVGGVLVEKPAATPDVGATLEAVLPVKPQGRK